MLTSSTAYTTAKKSTSSAEREHETAMRLTKGSLYERMMGNVAGAAGAAADQHEPISARHPVPYAVSSRRLCIPPVGSILSSSKGDARVCVCVCVCVCATETDAN